MVSAVKTMQYGFPMIVTGRGVTGKEMTLDWVRGKDSLMRYYLIKQRPVGYEESMERTAF